MRQTPETLSGANVSAWRLRPNRWDFVAFPMILGLLAMAAVGFHQTLAPMSTLAAEPISLDPSRLPEYALRTTLRMLAAMIASLVFTLAYGTLAAKSRRAEKILVPILDILQSVPVLGFISFTVTFFLALFPGRVLGAELAAIFAIFTSQAWNMTFSFYQSLRTVPRDLDEVSKNFQLTAWQRFWKLDVPFSMPGLVWNMMMSMSGGWFFVVASEAITVGNHTFALPGIGAYLAQAIDAQNTRAIGWVIVTMVVVILLYDQLLFRPLVAWADKFRMETTGSQHQPHSWLLDLIRKTRLIHQLLVPAGWVLATLARLPVKLPLPARVTAWLGSGRETTAALGRGLERGLERRLGRRAGQRRRLRLSTRAVDLLLAAVLLGMTLYFGWRVVHYMSATVSLHDVLHVFGLGLITLLRVSVLMLLASLVWVPVGILVGLRPALAEKVQPLAQFLAAFPANLLFPVFVIVIVRYHLNADIWLSPLIVLGTQWYILFNVVAGASAFPNDFREVATNLRIRGWQWWFKVMLPGVFPYYITGAITASGGAWNASIVAEAVSWGNSKVVAHGLGAYVAETTAAGDYPHIILGIAVMSLYVTLFNRLLWRPLYAYAETRLRFD
ncbi:ABC transporter permease subunit [Robbsia sp. Bb-Pol-6]|uniref:ABC transporter permease subunit n=1 Tax=Robbsia betulipollinis TaxID=2981849 RepID=A0ABT3ZMY3_9BURK|nr:ABC transporter permease subunit [Robbsia betulipollinis]MCY0387615.1 ABC transporter permease subunit [Robbsia betulipollinis]